MRFLFLWQGEPTRGPNLLTTMPRVRKPQILVLSPTRISSWLQCHLQYKFTYMDKLSRFFYRPNKSDTFGSVIHRTLETLHKMGGPQAVDVPELLVTLEQCWVSVGYQSTEEEDAMRQRGQQILSDYHQRESARQASPFLLEKQLRWDYGTFKIMGRLDRVDELPDGTLEIIDYKSGLLEVSQERVRGSIAMQCYSRLLTRHYPGRTIIATIAALAGGVSATVCFTDEDLELFDELAADVAAQITGAEEFLPNYGPHCEECIYKRKCYKDGEMDWEAKQNEFLNDQWGIRQ